MDRANPTSAADAQPAAADEQIDDQIANGDYFGVTGPKYTFVWKLDNSVGVRVGIADPGPGSRVEINANRTLRDALAETPAYRDGPFTIYKMHLPPGAFHARIARPSDQHPGDVPGMSLSVRSTIDAMVNALNQIRVLVGMLEQIFQSVHPETDNFACYGTAIRNLLILACTECEAQWKGVLLANDYQTKSQLNRGDYVKLVPALRLQDYGVSFRHYPWLPPATPYSGWEPADQRALFWYDDYNAAKHDREAEFRRASLRSAINAVCACWIMICGQYGFAGMREFNDLRDYFKLTSLPKWRYSDVYTHGYEGWDQEAGHRNYPF